jgi:hypothetical protein
MNSVNSVNSVNGISVNGEICVKGINSGIGVDNGGVNNSVSSVDGLRQWEDP